MATSPVGPGTTPGGSSWFGVTVAWLLVGLPLLWGVFNTVGKALALFR